MKNRDFLFCTAITAMCYLTMSVMYYSQIYLMYDFFSDRFIYMTADGWANIAQAAGMLLAIFSLRRKPDLYGSRFFMAGVLAAMFPVVCLSLYVPGAGLLFAMTELMNLLFGFVTACYFAQITAYLAPRFLCLSFALAYTVGSFATWLVSVIGESIMVTPRILPLDLILLAVCLALVLLYKNPCPAGREYASPAGFWRQNRLLIVILALMSAVSMLGSADNTSLTTDAGITLMGSRALYGLGLLFTAAVYTKNKNAGAICVMASLVWPFLAIVLFHEDILAVPACLLSYVTLGFFAVYRTGTFMDITSEQSLCPVFAVTGLAVSRIADAVTTIALGALYDKLFLASLIAAGLLFIPLLILFFYRFARSVRPAAASIPEISEAERRAAFAARYGLTRREEEIAFHLAQSRSNGEIAAALGLSENTVRFHVSNILHKTGLRDRNEVSHAYNARPDDN